MSRSQSPLKHRKFRRNCNRMMKWLAATSLAMAAPAYGLNVSWNVAGPSNNWDTVTANWTGDSTFYANGDNATFSNIAGETVTLVGVIAPNSTTVSAASGTYTFTGTGITTGTVTKSGGGTLVMNNANSYAGLTTVSGGVLTIGSNSALGSTAAGTTVANGARLQLTGNITVTGETITINGPGNNMGALQTLSGNNVWDGNIILGNTANTRIGAEAGTLTVSGVIDDGANTVDLNVRNNTGVTVLSGVSTYGGATNALVGILKLDGGNDRLPTGTVLTIGVNGNTAATFDLNGHNQTLAGIANAGTPTDNIITNTGSAASTLTVNNSVARTFSGNLTNGVNALNLTKTGAAELTLSGNNSGLTGLVDVVSGQLRFGSDTAGSASATWNIASGQTILFNTDVGGAGAHTVNLGALTGSGELRNGGLQAGTTTFSIGGKGTSTTFTGNINNFDGDTNTALTKVGAGSLTLAGATANTYTGLTTIAAGTLILDKNASGTNAIGGNISLTGGTLRWDESNQVIDTATLTQTGGTITFNGRSETFANYTKSNGNTTTNSNNTITITGTLNISGGGQFDINSPSTVSANAVTFTGGALTVGGGGGVLSVGAGGLSMTGSTMNLNAGTSLLNLGGNLTTIASGTEANIQRNGAGTNPTLDLLGGTRTFTIADGGAAIDLDIDNVNIANGGITKAGAGVLRLTGINTYDGATTINSNGGAIRIANASALGSTVGGTIVNGGGRLELSGGITVTGEALTISGGGNNFGALQSQSGDNTWAGSVLIGANDTRIATAGSGNILRVTGVIDDGASSHSIAVRHENANGILELSGANTYGGATNIFHGILRIAGADDRLPTGTTLAFGVPANTGGFNSTFDLNGFNQTVAGLTSVDTGTPDVITLTNSSATASTLTVNNAGANSFGGVASGNLAIVKGGVGTLTFTAANTYNGNTTINQGILALSGSGSIDNSPVISVGTGATFDVSAVTGTYNLASGQSLIGNGSIIGDVVTDAGSLISPGFSIGTLSFANNLDINGNILIEVDPAAAGQKIDIINIGGILDVAGANLVFDFLSSPVDGTYVFATYGSLVGDFATISGMPSGYEIKFNFNGQNQIALVSIPEPATMSLLALGSLGLLRRRRSV